MVGVSLQRAEGERVDIQSGQRKDKHQRDLLPLRQHQVLQHRHRQQHGQEIGRDIDAGVDEPNHVLVETMATSDILVPEIRHWSAGENGAEEGPEAVDDHDAEHDPACDPELGADEDAEVLHYDRDLGEGEGKVVEPDRGPESLELIHPFGIGETVLVPSHAILDLCGSVSC